MNTSSRLKMPLNKGHYADTTTDNFQETSYNNVKPTTNARTNLPIEKNKITAKLATGHRPKRRSINT